MEWWQALVLGIVQGLTEFLPVSSSGHLLLLQELMGVDVDDNTLDAFDVALHGGTLVALFTYFGRDLWAMFTGWLRSVRERKVTTPEQRLAWLILLGTIPAIAAYGAFGNLIEAAQENVELIAAMLIGFSVVFFAADLRRGSREASTIGVRDAVLVGCAQAFALIPGTSRSGATIATGMLLGLDRQAAARFSFLLSAPVILAAFVLTAPDLASAGAGDTGFLAVTALGFVAAAISGYFAVAVLLRFLGGHALSWFALYRVPAGILFLLYFLD